MRHRASCAAALVLLTVACGEREEAPAPRFELRPVLASRVASLQAEPEPALEVGPEAREAFESILGPLRAEDPDFRALALEDARSLPPEAAELAARALLDPAEPAATRIGLAQVLGGLATPRALQGLCDTLAVAAEPALRAQCAYRLALAGDDRVVPQLCLRLKYEKDSETVYWIADALARFGHLAGLEPLVVVREREQGELRASAGARLDELAREHECPTVDELRARWREGRLPARSVPSPALVLEGWRWIARLGEWRLRGVDDARYVLVQLEDWIVPLLAEALHEEDVHVRLHVAQCLERRGSRAAAAAAELELALSEPRIASAAAAALAALGATGAVPALERAAQASADPELRVAAARALGGLGLARSLPVLAGLFEHETSLDLRQAAAQALLALDPQHAARALVESCLTDPRADAGAAEVALGAWLTGQCAREASLAPVLERWKALAPAAGSIPTAAEQDERRRARAALLAELRR